MNGNGIGVVASLCIPIQACDHHPLSNPQLSNCQSRQIDQATDELMEVHMEVGLHLHQVINHVVHFFKHFDVLHMILVLHSPNQSMVCRNHHKQSYPGDFDTQMHQHHQRQILLGFVQFCHFLRTHYWI